MLKNVLEPSRMVSGVKGGGAYLVIGNDLHAVVLPHANAAICSAKVNSAREDGRNRVRAVSRKRSGMLKGFGIAA